MFVFQLPLPILKTLGEILDVGSSWETIASEMPDIQPDDVTGCRQSIQRHCSPTEELLRIWGTKGYTVLQLYKVFAKARHVRAMGVIRHLVDDKYHQLENRAITSIPQSTSSAAQSTADSVQQQRRPSLSSAASSMKQQQHQPASLLSSLPSTSSTTAVSESTNVLPSGLQNTPSVRYDELLTATGNFAQTNIIGRGGYGVVYRGEWKHTSVAVKRIQTKNDIGSEHQRERLRQSLMELRTLAMYRHDNILPLYGYSLDGPDPCLIYQYMANGSLEDRLLQRNNSSALTWRQRAIIADGTSRGLHFLHTIATQPLIHGDVKSANILLDKHLEPKIGDFGLCRVGQVEVGEEKSPLIASHIKGTLAYLPPEFISSKHLSTKLDVFSFGVVLLEIATGMRAYSDNRQPHSIVEYVQREVTNNSIDKLADSRLSDIDSSDHKVMFNQLLRVGLLCVQLESNARPSFDMIVDQLSSLLMIRDND